MSCYREARQACLALTIALASLGTAHATFPGENGVIVFGNDDGIWKVAPDGATAPVRILDAEGIGALNPQVSPNGKQVAYTVTDGLTTSLWSLNLNGGSPTLIVQYAGASRRNPAWSPDGKQLLVDRSGDSSRLLLVDVATKTMTAFPVPVGANISSMSWSPLGDKIAMGLGLGAGRTMVVDVATRQVSYVGVENASWFPAPAGALIGATGTSCLARVDATGLNLQVYPYCNVWLPTVAPDGSAVLVADNPGSPSRSLTVGDFYGKNRELLAQVSSVHFYADWSRVPKTAMRTTLTNNGWSAPVPLANDADTYIAQSAIAVMPEHGAIGGALRRAVGIGPDGRVLERAQAANGTWGAWFRVPGVPSDVANGMVARQVAIAGALDGSSQVVVVADDDLVYHAMRYPNGTWSGFNPVGGASGAPVFAARDVAIAIVNSSNSSPGQAHVVANGVVGGEVQHRVRLADGNWTPWGALGGPSTQSLAIAFAGNKDLYLLATTAAGGISRQIRRASGAWDGWVSVSGVSGNGLKDVSLTLASNVSTGGPVYAHLAYVDDMGGVVSQTRYAPTYRHSWTNPPTESATVTTRGRTVSMAVSAGVPELVVVQAQPQ